MNESAENYQAELEALQEAVDSVQTEGGDYSLPYICWRANIPADTLLRTPVLINHLCSALGISLEQFMIDELLSLYYRTLQLEEQVQQLSTNLQLEPETYALSSQDADAQSSAGTSIWAPIENQATAVESQPASQLPGKSAEAEPELAYPESVNFELGNLGLANSEFGNLGFTDLGLANPEFTSPGSANPEAAGPDPDVDPGPVTGGAEVVAQPEAAPDSLLEQIISQWNSGINSGPEDAAAVDRTEDDLFPEGASAQESPVQEMDPFTAKLMAALQAEAESEMEQTPVLPESEPIAGSKDYMSLDLLDQAIKGELSPGVVWPVGGGSEGEVHEPSDQEKDETPAGGSVPDVGDNVESVASGESAYLDDLLASSSLSASDTNEQESEQPGESAEDDEDYEGDSAEDADGTDNAYSADELRNLYTKTLNKEEQKEEWKEKLKNSTPLKKFVGGNKLSSETAATAAPRVVPPDVRKSCLMLGIKPEDVTSKSAVLEAWKHEMAKPGVHPDTGGDTEMAIYLNTAKDTLIRWLETKDPKLGKKFGSQATREPQSN